MKHLTLLFFFALASIQSGFCCEEKTKKEQVATSSGSSDEAENEAVADNSSEN